MQHFSTSTLGETGVWWVMAVLIISVTGCDLTPSRPEDVFMVFRERMRAGNTAAARTLLSDDSRKMVESLKNKYKLENPPEDLSILNSLDPQGIPTATIVEEKFALLKVRTLRGVPRMIRVVRDEERGDWKINLTEELGSLEAFLEAQNALEMLRDTAGDYAATWKAFSDQLDRITILEDPKEQQSSPGRPVRKEGHRKNPR